MGIYCKILTLTVLFISIYFLIKKIKDIKSLKCSKTTNTMREYYDCIGKPNRKTMEEMINELKIKRDNNLKHGNL